MEKSEIVQANLEKMLSLERGGMVFALSQESIGGNAGNYERHNCIAVNFVYIPDTGEIKEFGNNAFKSELPEGKFRFIAHHVDATVEKWQNLYELIEIYPYKGFSENAMEVLKESGQLYNKSRTGKVYGPRGIRIQVPH